MNKTCKKIKNIGSSPLYIISAVFLLISAALIVLKFFMAPEYFKDATIPLLPGSELSFVPWYYPYVYNFAFLPFLLKAALDLLTFFGMFLVFITMCRKKEESCKLGAGKGFIKTAAVIEMIISFMFVGFIFALQLSHIMPYFVDMVDLGDEIPQNEIIRLVIAFLVMVLVIVFNSIYVKKISVTIKAVDKTLKKGIIMGKVSVFLIVYNYIIILIHLALLTFMFLFDRGDLIMKASVLCALVSRLLSNINLASMRSEMLYIKARGFNS